MNANVCKWKNTNALKVPGAFVHVCMMPHHALYSSTLKATCHEQFQPCESCSDISDLKVHHHNGPGQGRACSTATCILIYCLASILQLSCIGLLCNLVQWHWGMTLQLGRSEWSDGVVDMVLLSSTQMHWEFLSFRLPCALWMFIFEQKVCQEVGQSDYIRMQTDPYSSQQRSATKVSHLQDKVARGVGCHHKWSEAQETETMWDEQKFLPFVAESLVWFDMIMW